MARGEVYTTDHNYLTRTPIDPNPDLTGIRNEASTDIHGFSLLGGKAIRALCEERINDNFRIKLFNPEQEKRDLQLKVGIVAFVASFLGVLIGSWWGRHLERKEQEEQRRRRYWSNISSKLKRRHARDWVEGLKLN